MLELVVQFPALAAWLIVAGGGVLGTALLAVLTLGGRQFMRRMDAQDGTLKNITDVLAKEIGAIKDLLASETGHLREMQHEIDKRVVSIEAYLGASYLGRARTRKEQP